MTILFLAHSWLRYLVLVVALAALIALTYSVATGRSVRPARILANSFAGLLDLQIVLGIGLVMGGVFPDAVTGHLMGAAGALETVVTALAIHHREMPLTQNHQEAAPECDLDYIRGQSRPYPIRVALNVSSGFGGKNSCLVLGRYDR